MGFNKKVGKGRLDKYYYLAKDQGYRARSAFKLVQLHKRYNLLDQARVVIDLCAAPGGWLQVAAKYMPGPSPLIIGVDLVPIKPIPGVSTIVADIRTARCRSELKKELGGGGGSGANGGSGWKADVVLHDGAPNVGRAWIHDAYSQSELVLHSLKLASEFLMAGGSFVTKVFRSKEYNALLWVFGHLFERVEATKPASSRTVSAEIFVVCRGYRAPDRIDPRLLDPRFVFDDLAALKSVTATGGSTASTSMAVVSGAMLDLQHPEKRTRQRDGYEEGQMILFKSISALDFVKSTEPNIILATHNRIVLEGNDKEADQLNEQLLSFTSQHYDEVPSLVGDLKVLGRREFKILVKWRKAARQHLGLEVTPSKDAKEDEEGGKDPDEQAMDDEDAEMEALEKAIKLQRRMEKRERRKALERKAKERLRMNIGDVTNTEDILMEGVDSEQLFSLAATARTRVSTGDSDLDDHQDGDNLDVNVGEESDADTDTDADDSVSSYCTGDASSMEESDDESRRLLELEAEFEGEQPGRRERKRLRNQISQGSEAAAEEDGDLDAAADSDSDDAISEVEKEEDEEDEEIIKEAVKSKRQRLQESKRREAEEMEKQKKAKIDLWYSNPIFAAATASSQKGGNKKDADGSDDENNDQTTKKKKNRREKDKNKKQKGKKNKNNKDAVEGGGEEEESKDTSTTTTTTDIVFVKADTFSADEEEEENDALGDGDVHRFKEALLTPAGMTLAQRLAADRRKAKKDLIDDSFNRYSTKDDAGQLPRWFLDDERGHRSREPQKPISKEAVAELKARMRQLASRPIKKELEAKGRNRQRLVRKLEALRQKADNIVKAGEGDGLSERQKGERIERLMASARTGVKKREKKKLVVAKGRNRGLKGRPKGVKGHYKMVDGRMKKDMRAAASAGKKKRGGRR